MIRLMVLKLLRFVGLTFLHICGPPPAKLTFKLDFISYFDSLMFNTAIENPANENAGDPLKTILWFPRVDPGISLENLKNFDGTRLELHNTLNNSSRLL